MLQASQTHREASVHCALADDVLLFQEMHGSEQLGRLFEWRVQMVSAKHDIKIADVLGKSMTVSVDLPAGGQRHFNGIVTRFCNNGWRGGFSSYEAIVQPALWLLTRSSNCRIFQDKTAIEIVKEVCADSVYGGLITLDLKFDTSCEPRSYCVQYRETDFNFVCRLLEEEGIYYYFTHEAARHTMVLADSYSAHTPILGGEALKFRSVDARRIDDEAVTMWSPSGQIEPNVFVLNDFDFEKAASSNSGGLRVKAKVDAAFSQPTYEQYDYPGNYQKDSIGTAFARGRMEAIHGQCEQISARSTARGLTAGGLFSLTEHPREDQNREFLITGAEIDITAQDYTSGAGHDTGMVLNCAFTAVGKEYSYRPPLIMRKPFVQGPQTAMVVGKAGEEIWTDKYGRVKVQFHWDRLGAEDEKSSCWVRVSQSWAGKRWGSMFIPRIGMEVVVDFLEGDPDRPLVTGCVYNGDALPPYELPAEQTKSTFMSNSSKDGGGYNEIRFEDKKDAEEIYVQAEKDYLRVVKNNDTLKVGFEKKDKGDQTIAIHNDQSLKVGNDQTIAIDNDQSLEVGNNQSLEIGNDQKTKVGNTCVIEASTSIELKVGTSSIKIEPGKITIKSAQIAVEADTTVDIKANATMSLKSSAVMMIEGSLVKIN